MTPAAQLAPHREERFHILSDVSPDIWRLMVVRGLRSFSQGYLNIVTPLYLISLGLSSVGLGLLFTASFLVGGALLVPVGIFADRIGRKPFLLAFTILMVVWGTLYAGTVFLPALVVISAIAGIGRGGGMGGGQGGPFAPAEQALLADLAPPERRHDIFSWNAFIGTLLAAAGAGIAGLVGWLRVLPFGPLAGDRLLFALTGAIGFVSLVVLLPLHEPDAGPRPVGSRILSKSSSGLVVRQATAGAFNAFGLGLVNALFVVWLHLRYGVDASAIGPVFGISYLLMAFSFFFASALAKRIGSVHAIVATRLAAAVLMVLIAVAPTFAMAAGLQVLRTVVTMMITPVRQSFTMGIYPARERASASGITGLVRRVCAAVAPSVTGGLFTAGFLAVPFFGGAILQVFSAGLYLRFFGAMNDVRRIAAVRGEDLALEVDQSMAGNEANS